MKKIILTFAVCICMVFLSHAQECEVVPFKSLGIMYPAMQIDLLEKEPLDLSRFNLLAPQVKNLSSDSAYKAYIAPSDSSIMVFLVDDQISFFKFCSSKIECDTMQLYIEQNIIEEFTRLQPAGIFQGSVAEADSLIHYIVQKIKDIYPPLPSELAERSEISFSSAVYTMVKSSEGEYIDYAGKIIPVSSLCIYNRNGRNLYFCDLIDSVRQCGADFRQESSTSLKPSVYRITSPGTRYRAFDMNGNFIRSGTWHENSADEFHTPVIVRFENGVAVPLYKKNNDLFGSAL